MSGEKLHVQDDVRDALQAFMRTAELLNASGVSMLDIAGSMTVLLSAAIRCLPNQVQVVASEEYSKIVADAHRS